MFTINELYVSRLDGCVDSFGQDYSVSNLASRVGISRQQAYKILSGVSVPRIDTAHKICEYVTELFGFEISIEDFWLFNN